MHRWLVFLVTAVVMTPVLRLHGQAPDPKPLAFEVASVKPSTSGESGFGISGPMPSQFTTKNAPLDRIIGWAFGVRDDQLINLPGWTHTERFDIVAKYPSGTKFNTGDVEGMVQTLLIDRFKLQARHEMREGPIYELVLARRDKTLGPRLKPHTFDCATYLTEKASKGEFVSATPFGDFPLCAPMIVSGQFIKASVRSISVLANAIAIRVQRPVVDQTGLTDTYDFNLEWSPTPQLAPTTRDATAGLPQPDEGLSLFTALEEQLGLKLEPRRGPVDVLVIDHVERPTPD